MRLALKFRNSLTVYLADGSSVDLVLIERMVSQHLCNS